MWKGKPAATYVEPPEISIGFVFLPLAEAMPRGTSPAPNFKAVKVDFSFDTILPSYAYMP